MRLRVKKWIAIASGMGLLALVWFLLLNTRQAPLITEEDVAAEKEVAKMRDPEPAASAPESAVPAAEKPANSPATMDFSAASKDLIGGKKLTAEEFSVLAQDVSKTLPSKKDLQKLTAEEAHFTPKVILEAGTKLGLIAQAVENEPSLQRDAFAFYQQCSAAPTYPDSVRALCYSNYKALAKGLGVAMKDNSIPANIRQLADKLQGL